MSRPGPRQRKGGLQGRIHKTTRKKSCKARSKVFAHSTRRPKQAKRKEKGKGGKGGGTVRQSVAEEKKVLSKRGGGQGGGHWRGKKARKGRVQQSQEVVAEESSGNSPPPKFRSKQKKVKLAAEELQPSDGEVGDGVRNSIWEKRVHGLGSRQVLQHGKLHV